MLRHPFVNAALAATSTLLALALAGCGKAPDSVSASVGLGSGAIPITTATATAQALPRTVHLVGSLAALEQATLSNRVTGNVTKVYVDLGDTVKPGQKLAEIDPERFELARQQAEQAMRETLAHLGLTAIPTGEFDVDTTSMVKRAKSDEESESIKFERSSNLYKQQLIKDFEYFDQKAAYQMAQSSAANARDDARATLASARQKQKLIDILAKDLSDATIKAPDGTTPDGTKIESYTISARHVSTGEYVREGTAIITLVADGTLKLQSRVPERYMGEVKKKQTIYFTIEAYKGERFPATITAMDPAVEPTSRTFLVEARVENADGRLRPGSFVQGDIETRIDPHVITVPVDALASFAGVTKVYVVEKVGSSSQVRSIQVETGQQAKAPAGSSYINWVEVSPPANLMAGGQMPANFLNDGDQVVTSGLSKLTDQMLVVVRKDVATTTAAQ